MLKKDCFNNFFLGSCGCKVQESTAFVEETFVFYPESHYNGTIRYQKVGG
jgi:hypothetical protein